MTCHLDWSLLDSSVSDALRDFINAKIQEECQSKVADYMTKQKEKQLKDHQNSSLISLKPLTNIQVTKIWFGTEAPLLEIIEVGPAPNSHSSSSSSLEKQLNLTPTHSTNNISTMTSPNASFPHHQLQQQPGSSSIFLMNSSSSPNHPGMNSKQPTIISRQESTSSSCAVSSSSPFGNNNNNTISLGGDPKNRITRTKNSTRVNQAKVHQQPPKMSSQVFSSITTTSSTTPSNTHHQNQNNNQQQQQQQQAPPTPQKETSFLDAFLGETGFQIRIHLVHSGSAGIEIFVDPEIQIRFPFSNHQNDVFGFAMSQRKRKRRNPNNRRRSMMKVVKDGDPENKYEEDFDDENNEDEEAADDEHESGDEQTDDDDGDDGKSDDQDQNDDDEDEEDEGLIASVRFPMLFDISDFHFDIVINVTIRGNEGISIRIEPDRFGGEGAEGRILSSLSIVAKAGAGLLHTRMNNNDKKRGVENQQQNEETLIDQDCARSLVLKELRAILARTLVQGLVIPLKK